MTQERRRYEVALRGQVFTCRRVRGREAVSEPFRFEVELARGPFDFEPAELVGDAAALHIVDDVHDRVRAIAAVVTTCERDLLAAEPAVTLVLEPRLALLRHRRDVRSFLDRSAIAIVEELLTDFGIAVEERLGAHYGDRDYTLAWRESELDFLSRLLEDEGVHYVVADDGHVVLGDGPPSWDESGLELDCAEGHGLDGGREAIVEIGWESELAPTEVLLRDYDFERPRLDLAGRSPVAHPAELPPRTFYDYPGELTGGVDPARRAARYAEAFSAGAVQLRALALSPAPRPGTVLRIEHPPADVRAGRYVVLAVAHDFDLERGGFAVTFTALAADQPFRPPRVTTVPEIAAAHTAFVVGPEDIHTDAWGRVTLHFPWDRRRPRAERSTAWVPCTQDNTGHSCAIPRRGWEVVVQYLEGDPDRPVVLGRVYNGGDPPPDKLPDNKTRSRIQSLVTPSRGGVNMIELDDLEGAETFRIFAERDHVVTLGNDRRSSVLADETARVRHDETLTVGRDRRTQVGGDVSLDHKSAASIAIGGERRVDVDMAIDSAVTGDATLIAPVHIRRIGSHESASGGTGLVETVGGVVLEAARENHGTSAGGPVARAVGGAMIDLAAGFSSSTAGSREQLTGGIAFVSAGDALAIQASETRTSSTPGDFTVVAGGSIDLSAGASFVLSAGQGELAFPSAVTLKVGNTTLTAKDGALTLGGTSEIRVTIGGEAIFSAPFVKQI